MNGREKERLVKLETKFKERWDNHDKRSEEIWSEIKKDIKNIYNLFGEIQKSYFKLPCHSMATRITLIMIAVGFLYSFLAMGIWRMIIK